MASTGGSETAAKANGLLDRFQKDNTVLGLHLALEVLEEMECLNKSLQKQTSTVAGMCAAVDYVKKALQEKRTEENLYRSLTVQQSWSPHLTSA